jgi:hypothetical protein
VLLPSVFKSGLFYLRLIASADNFHHWLKRRLKKPAYLSPGIAMRLTHEVITDNRNSEFFFGWHEF